MTEIRSLTSFSEADLRRCATGYVTNKRYEVSYADSEESTAFQLMVIELDKSYVGLASEFDEDTLSRYEKIVQSGWSFGAYEDGRCIGVAIAEAQGWNKSVMVWEFHVEELHRRKGIGRQLMERVIEGAEHEGMRAVICETQTTNTGAIAAYRRLGFRMEAIDISLYSNEDYPNKEVAVFMKRRL